MGRRRKEARKKERKKERKQKERKKEKKEIQKVSVREILVLRHFSSMRTLAREGCCARAEAVWIYIACK